MAGAAGRLSALAHGLRLVRRWIERELFEALMRALARRQRRRCGRRPDPRRAIIDTQSVKCIRVRGPRGDDGAKKRVGRKRVALVDAEGHLLALGVVPADMQDRDTLPALDADKEKWPSLRLAILDGVFTVERCQEWCNFHCMRHRVVEKKPYQKVFVVMERSWVVERTFGWLRHWGDLHRERSGRLEVATERLVCVASLMAANALNNPARNESPDKF